MLCKHSLACRYVKTKLWRNQNPGATKCEVEERWRQTHKAAAMQLAPYLTDVHDKPPLARTIKFLDTVQALIVPALLLGGGSCISLSCALPGVPCRFRAEDLNAEHPCRLAQAECQQHQRVVERAAAAGNESQGNCVREQDGLRIDRCDLQLVLG
jgi:hypothetical protein